MTAFTNARARREAKLDRDYIVLLIANDLTALLAREPAQREAALALAAEIERAATRWLRCCADSAKRWP